MDHRKGQWIFGLTVGLVVALAAYRWITDPAPREERLRQEQAVQAARTHLDESLGLVSPELVDPLAPQRKVGKVYVYRAGEGWEVSGYYRRGEEDEWHPYLMSLDAALEMTHLVVRDGHLPRRRQPGARRERGEEYNGGDEPESSLARGHGRGIMWVARTRRNRNLCPPGSLREHVRVPERVEPRRIAHVDAPATRGDSVEPETEIPKKDAEPVGTGAGRL